MNEVGSYALHLGFAASVVGLVCGLFGIFGRNYRLATVARNALYATCFLSVLATARLLSALLGHDFTLRYVALFSSTDMPTYYLVTSLWGGHAGSMLFWVSLLSVFGAAVAYFHRTTRQGMLLPATHVVLLLLLGFFFFVLCFVPGTDPFEPVGPGELPRDFQGKGLNPLLQDPVMAVHPPALYVGFVGLAVPFAFAMGALIAGRKDVEWIRLSRWWTMFSWNFLTLGIILGGFWAYRELGWGGYWAWDAVENSSFLPWLAATAFLHSVMVTEKYRMLKVWNLVLIFLAFALTIFGTFLTRSGFLTSVHTFAESPEMFYTFGGFLIGCFALWLGLVLWRWSDLKSENRMHSFLSREFMFLANNLVLVSLTFIILTFTLWPEITEKIVEYLPWVAEKWGLTKQTIGPSAFSQWTAPFFLLLVLLTGLGTATSWKMSTRDRLARALVFPALLAVAGGASCVLVIRNYFGLSMGLWSWQTVAAWALVFFVLGVTADEFRVAARARNRARGEGVFGALFNLYCRNHRRYGGYLVHVGVVFIVLGIATQRPFQQEITGSALKGKPFSFAGFELRYEGSRQFRQENMQIAQADLSVSRAGEALGRIHTEKRVYDSHPDQTMTEVGYLTTHGLTSNLYLVLAGDPGGRFAPVQVFFNPLVNVIWFGSAFMMANGYLLLLPWDRIGRWVRNRRSRSRERREQKLEEAVLRRRQQVV